MSAAYAGVNLLVDTAEHAEYVATYHDVILSRLTENSGYRDDMYVLPFPPEPVDDPPRIGVLRWPTGASRCATFYAVVDGYRLSLIRAAVGDPVAYASLVLSDGTSQITASMRMLPPLPLHQCSDDDSDGTNLYLLRLADRRFWWRWTSGNVTVGDGTTWGSVVSQIASAMSASVTVGDVELGYDEPSYRWTTYRKPLPALLDAACNAVGHRLVVGLTGAAFTTDWVDATAAADAQFDAADFKVTVGGRVANGDIVRAVPAGVRVCFGQIIGGVAQPDPFTLPIALADLAHPGYGASTGVVGATATINADLIYDGTNAAACAAYAEQAAYDFYGWKLCDLDFTAPGIVAWEPTGVEDAVEWYYQDGGRLLTRVVLGPFQTQPLGGWEVETEWRFPLVRITAVGGAAGEFDYTYTVLEVEIDDGEQVVDLTEEWSGVVETEDRLLPVSAGPDPEEGVYTLMRAPDGHYYIDAEPTAGCGLTEDPATGAFEVDFAQLAGRGLTVGSWDGSGSGSAECQQLDVLLNTDCGLDYDPATATVGLDLTDVVFDGLYWDDALCHLGVLTGCGLTYGPTNVPGATGDAIVMDLTDVVANGLYWDGDLCELGVSIGCGLQYFVNEATETVLQVDAVDVAGDNAITALVPNPGGEDCAVGVDLEAASTTTEVSDKILAFGVVGGQLRLRVLRTTYTNHFNLAGLHIDRTADIPEVRLFDVDLCDLICDGSGSGSGGDSGSGGGPGSPLTCCSDRVLPDTFTLTVTAETGDCTCLPATVTLGPAYEESEGVWRWDGPFSECGGCEFALQCVDGAFILGNASCIGTVTQTALTCDPFSIEFDVDNSTGGVICSGTFHVTITE
jgi:hypothetical protein